MVLQSRQKIGKKVQEIIYVRKIYIVHDYLKQYETIKNCTFLKDFCSLCVINHLPDMLHSIIFLIKIKGQVATMKDGHNNNKFLQL